MFNRLFILGTLVFCVGYQAEAAFQCSNQLQNQLLELPAWMLEDQDLSAGDVSNACIQRSMKVFYEWTSSVRQERAEQGLREIGHYVYCDPQSERVITKHQPPCPTPQYLNSIRNTYNSVLKCVGFDPKHLFALTAVESGFQINTLSLAGVDIGIGQLTPIAVEDVNPHWQEYIAEIQQNSSPDCETIKPLLHDLQRAEDDLICALTDLPSNPVKNLIYISFLHKKNQDYMNRLFDIHGLKVQIENLIGRVPTESEIQNIKEILITLSYNAGSPTAVQALEDFIQNTRAPLKEIENEIFNKTNEAALLYLDAQSAIYSDQSFTAEMFLANREIILEEITALNEAKLSFVKPIEVFAVNGETGSFGEYLVETETSFYLEILKDRIEYVEQGIGAPGACAPEDYLESI